MPFTMPCPTKGCGTQTPYIDPKTDKVYCPKCNQEIPNITHFAKVQMKTLKQYKEKKGKSFSVKCNHCNLEDRPVPQGNTYICSGCKKELNLSHAFKVTLKALLPSADKEL